MVMVDPLIKLASIQSSEVGFGKMPADIASVGVPAFGAKGMVSDPTDGAPGVVELVGCIALIVAVPAGQGDGVERWMAGSTRSFRRPTR